MSKWLETARLVTVPNVSKSPKVEIAGGFGTNGTFGTQAEDRMGTDVTAFEERAAICEFDGELPRSHAELLQSLPWCRWRRAKRQSSAMQRSSISLSI